MSERVRGDMAMVISDLQALGIDVAGDEDVAELRARLEAVVIRLVTSPSAHFDRGRYQALMHLWESLAPEQGGDADAI